MFLSRRAILATACALGALVAANHANALPFNTGDLVVSVIGNTDGSKPTDNQAAPIQLIELTNTGTVVGSMLLPQTMSGANYAISGEYGSSSEALLHLSADTHSLVIAGYGVNAATFNAGGAAVYGDARLAQTTSVFGAVSAVPRVIADINARSQVDTSTALFNAFDKNNPRSVATVDGTSFYIAGQGAAKTDTATQGVFLVQDGTTSMAPTHITGQSDFRSISIQNGTVYASRDVNAPAGVQYTEIDRFATAQPTGASTPTALPGIGPSITLSTASFNGVNNSRGAGNSAYLSPQDSVFLTDPATGMQYVYIADTGNPKNGSVGKAAVGVGGLQKWALVNGSWVFQYDIYSGLPLVPNFTTTGTTTTASTTGTTGLIGLTGMIINGQAYFYATNSTLGDLDQTYLFSVTDPLTQTNRGAILGSDMFNMIYTAAAGTNVRGVAFAPVPEPASMLLLGTGLAAVALRRRKR